MSNATVEEPASTIWNSFTVVGGGTASSTPNPEDQALVEELKADGIDPNAEPVTPVTPKEEERAPEKPAEKKGIEVHQPEEKPAKEPSKATRENFAKLEKKAQEAEQRAAKIEADRQADLARLKEYEEKLAHFANVNPEEFTKKEQAYIEQLNTLRSELRTVALERDPDFIAQFDHPRQVLQENLKTMAADAGVDQNEFQRAMRMGPDKLDEIRDTLAPHQQRKWDAALTEIERIELQRGIALQNKDKTFEELNLHRSRVMQEQSTRAIQQNLQIAHQIALEPFEKLPMLKDDAELQAQVRSTLEAVAGGNGSDKWDVPQILRNVAAAQVLPRLLNMQAETNKQLEEKLAEVQKELEEANTFIKSKHGSLPRNEVKDGPNKPAEDKRPFWEQIKVVRPK